MKLQFAVVLGFGLFSSHAAIAGDAPPAAESILRDLGARNAGYHDFGGTVDMVLKDGGSEAKRRFSLKVLERPSPQVGDQVLIVFESPADVKGTALLSHAKVGEDDEQWIYLPQTKRTKRIASSNRTGSFVGSEFTYEDLSGSEARKYAWRTLGTAPCAGNLQCWQLEATPKDSSSAYSKRILTVDTSELRIFSTDFFDRAGTKVKTLTYDDYAKVGGKYWRAQRWTMQNHQSGKSTVLTFSKLAVATGVSASEFSAAKLGER